jgi:plastocyanin
VYNEVYYSYGFFYMTKTGWIVAVVVLVVLIAGYFLWSSNASAPATTQTTTTTTTGSAADTTTAPSPGTPSTSVDVGTNVSVQTGGAPMSAKVVYDGHSFTPASVTIAKGGTVTFTDTAGSMWLASDPHPVHTAYDGTSRSEHCALGYTGAKPFDECSMGSSFSFTFNKTGTFGYHDHMNASAHGTVSVQ